MMYGMAPTRRRLLQIGAVSGVAVALGGVGLALQAGTTHAPNGPLRAVDAREYSVLWAFAERIAPKNPPFPAAHEVDVAGKVDALLAMMDPASTAEVRLLLRLLDNALAGLLLDGRFRTFTACSEDEQDRILEGWRTSRLAARRMGFTALRKLVAGAYYGSPELYPILGYAGPPDYSLVDALAPPPPEGAPSALDPAPQAAP